MSEDLDDLKRLKVTRATTAWLRARAHATGRTRQEIAREALHRLAMQDITEARVLIALADSEGLVGDGQANGRATQGQRGRR